MEAGVEGDRRVRKGGSGQINEWQRRRGGTEGNTRPTRDGGGHREKGWGRGEAERAAVVRREEELEEEGGEMERGADS